MYIISSKISNSFLFHFRTSSSQASSHRSASALENSDYVGMGVIGHADESDLQQRLSSRFSSGSAVEADDLQRRENVGLSDIQAAAYRQSSRRNKYREEEEEENDLQKTVGAGYHDLSVNNDRYTEAQRRSQYQKESESRVTTGGRPVYYVPGGSSSAYRSSGSAAESQFSESRTQRPIAVPVGSYVNLQVRPGTSTVLAIPVGAQDVNRVYSNRQNYQAGSEASRTRVQPGYRVNYYPSYTSDRTVIGSTTDSESTRTSTYQKPEKLVNNEYSSSRYNKEESESQEDTQQRISPLSPLNSGSVRYTSTGGSTNYQQGYTSNRIVPVVPINTIESTSSQKSTAEEQEQRRYTQVRPSYTQRTSGSDQSNSGSTQYTSVNRPVYTSSRTSENEGSQYGSSGTNYYTIPTGSQSRTQSQQSASQSQYQAGSGMRSGYGGYSPLPAYSRGTGSGSRFNTQTMSSGTDNLMEFMSESERLARIQQQQVASSSSSTSALMAAEANRRTVNTASNLDTAAANFVSSNNLSSRLSDLDNVENLSGNGGFQRVKSWQKQSKWASGK